MEQHPLSSVTIRPVMAADDPFIARIFRTNFEQSHLNIPGTAYFGPELHHLSAFCSARPGRGYFVAVGEDGTVLGGCGFAETAIFDRCAELQKLYLSDAAKGASASADVCRKRSSRPPGTQDTKSSISRCTPNSTPPSAFKLGFQPILKPQGMQHGAMDRFYLKSL